MFRIEKNGIITITRGDNASAPIFINTNNVLLPEQYTLTENDALYVGVMEPNQLWEDAIIKKKYTSESETDDDGNVLLIFTPEDTEYLRDGKYYYMIKLRKNIGLETETVYTILDKTLFWVVD